MKRTASRNSEAEVYDALKTSSSAFGGVAIFSAIINLLMLTGSIYMLQIYDRVLSSRSIPTLVGISFIILCCYILQGSLDSLRSKMLARIGARFDEQLSGRIFDLVVTMPLKGARQSDSMQPIRDLDQIRGFLSGLGPTALFDMPFMPIFLIACFLIHPWLGVLAIFGGIMIVGLTLLTEKRSQAPMAALTRTAADRHMIADAGRRNAEAVRALGMRRALAGRFAEANERHVAENLRAAEAASGIGTFAKIFRMVLQSSALGLGAVLVIRGELSGGSMIACSILMSRALAPIEIAVAHWKGFVAARQGYHRLEHILSLIPPQDERLTLPAPRSTVEVNDLFAAAPGSNVPIVQAVSFELKAGQGLGLIGPSASGKSTLARALVGVWPGLRGEVRLDGATLDQWVPDDLGKHIGYLPQDVELFEGTVAENIARFRPNATPEKIIAAAQAAGAHELILHLADGYETKIGEGGAALSGGQRQRVALARALYGDPFLVVLDEPNASLDGAGDEALNRAIMAVRQRGGVVVVITHRPAALGNVDLVAILESGRIKTMGPRDEVLQAMMKRNTVPVAPRAQPQQAGAAQAANLREVG